ncbi:unnamed protein product [Euphydryas editha]|uniref:Breast cancer type 2 susceptibility protein n=1 Tax=Euphydryas editha TaxID=104508 RepID=A0AAU9UR79_EUPED|nr:unnamed protein product [Euphydryas editha]
MNNNEADIFANTLKKSKVQKPVALYHENERNYQKNLKEYSVQSALVNVSKQIKSFQSADSIMKGNSNRRNLDMLKTNEFLPLTMMSTENQSEQIPSNKFETQCILDTQLINIIENAEALIDIPYNMNQELDNTFNNIDMCNRQNVELNKEMYSINSKDKEILEIANKTTTITEECDKHVNSEVNKSSERKSNLKDFEAERITEEEMCYLDHNDDIDTAPKSPILNSSPKKPLVFKLETFENFEKIALSVIRDNPDFESAKILINSQIMNNELFIQSHAEPVLCDRDKSTSPILNINKHQRKDEEKKIDDKYLIVEDNILFSDDDDDFKNDFQNLPLTCALETSFYNQSDVLDKTMYVGFQTASNKSIQVHTDTYSKAKSILDNIKTPEDYISLTRLVEVIDKHSKLNNNTIECNKERNKTKFEDEDNFLQDDVDFETEFEKDINIPEAVKKSKRNFEDVLKCDHENNSMDKFENNDINIYNNKKLKISENTLQKSVKNTKFNAQINLTENLRNIEKDEITPLNDHFKIDEHIMKEFESNFIAEDNCSGNSMKTDKLFDDKVNDNLRVNNDANKVINDRAFMGFKTANNEEIKISEQALAKTKNIFEDINLDNLEETANNFNKDIQNYNAYADQPSTSKSFIGFRTANNKDIKVSELALAKVKNIFEDINLDNLEETANNFNKDVQNYNAYADQPSTSKSFIGFRTANNKDIKVSELALAKVKNIFEDINLDNLEETANNFNKDIQNCNAYADQPSTSKSFIGFRTANNKDIKVSELALAKVKNIFEDINLDNLEETANNFNKDVQNYNAYADQPSTSKSFIGFRTANNKDIQVSESALVKTKNIFDHIDNEMPINKTAIENSASKFKKINNKGDFINPIPLSRSANNISLKSSKMSTNESISTVLNHDHKKPVPTFIGFQTASNKRVEISKEALAKTKNIFKEIMSQEIEVKACKEDENCTKDHTLLNEFEITESKQTSVRSTESVSHNHTDDKITFKSIGFKTASNKPVKISKEALEKSKNIFQDLVFDDQTKIGIDINKNMAPDALMQLFKTASDKPVSISDEALAKTKSIFQDIDNLYSNNDYKDINNVTDKMNNSLQGFKTASNKPVTITEEALAKSKELLKEFKVCTKTSELDLVEDPNKFVFEGFKIANNKSVKVSEDALEKSKKVFQDLNFEIADNEGDEKEKNKFFGFQTASNKTVSVSTEALLKSKQIFEDIDLNCNLDDNEDKVDTNTVKNTFGFKTAGNKNVNISEASLINAKKIFDDVNTTNIIQNETNKDCDIEELMNTEVIKNLEESLHTEDFSKETSPISKRSGSPILSCPKAKKRKVFKIPQTMNKIYVPNNLKTTPPTNVYVFNENYKRNKKYTLKDIKEMELINSNKNIDPYILNFNFDTLLDFEFGGKRNDIDSDIWTTDKIIKRFTESVNTKIVPEGWISNHLKLIIWKLISYEVYFPIFMKDICTVKNVLHQLKYRYNRELYNVERPALRKILEKDEVASKLMVLCVTGLYIGGICVSSVTSENKNIELSLTDGWYCIKACTDRMIDKLICDGKICVGTKLAICGAELMNCEQGIAPWEVNDLYFWLLVVKER